MQEQNTTQAIDFASSFKSSLESFEKLSSGRRADFERASVKERQSVSDQKAALVNAEE